MFLLVNISQGISCLVRLSLLLMDHVFAFVGSTKRGFCCYHTKRGRVPLKGSTPRGVSFSAELGKWEELGFCGRNTSIDLLNGERLDSIRKRQRLDVRVLEASGKRHIRKPNPKRGHRNGKGFPKICTHLGNQTPRIIGMSSWPKWVPPSRAGPAKCSEPVKKHSGVCVCVAR